MRERKWQMTRVGAGDYLLPSNDEQTLWRITKYEERDGTLTRGDGTVVNGDFWALWRLRFPLPDYDAVDHDLWDWDNCFPGDDLRVQRAETERDGGADNSTRNHERRSV